MVQATTACVVKRRSPTIPWEQQQATRSASTHRQPNPIDQPNQNICPTSAPHFARPSAPCPCRTAQPLRPAQLTTASAPTSHRHTARRPPPRPAAAQQKPAHPIAPATGRILRPTTARAPARSPPSRPRPASAAPALWCRCGTAYRPVSCVARVKFGRLPAAGRPSWRRIIHQYMSHVQL